MKSSNTYCPLTIKLRMSCKAGVTFHLFIFLYGHRAKDLQFNESLSCHNLYSHYSTESNNKDLTAKDFVFWSLKTIIYVYILCHCNTNLLWLVYLMYQSTFFHHSCPPLWRSKFPKNQLLFKEYTSLLLCLLNAFLIYNINYMIRPILVPLTHHQPQLHRIFLKHGRIVINSPNLQILEFQKREGHSSGD